ncbi:hypothetical protein [Vibrio algicola]|uniref:Uncharacterized protein n=1 Tax=Vibrio algicola TaxID=2662262 RepID=A0A5Q0TIS8_9VIBR|nr:hypothetical protein [Vibrio algicola]
MKTNIFLITIEQMIDMTRSSCKVAESQNQESVELERDALKNIIKKCERGLAALDSQK